MKKLDTFISEGNQLKAAQQKLAHNTDSMIIHKKYKDVLKAHDYKFYPQHSAVGMDEWRRGGHSVVVDETGWQHFRGNTDTMDSTEESTDENVTQLDQWLGTYHDRRR